MYRHLLRGTCLLFLIVNFAITSSKLCVFFVCAQQVSIGVGELGAVEEFFYDVGRDSFVFTNSSNEADEHDQVLTFSLKSQQLLSIAGSPCLNWRVAPFCNKSNCPGAEAVFNGLRGIAPVYTSDVSTTTRTKGTSGAILAEYRNNCIRFINLTFPFWVKTVAGVCSPIKNCRSGDGIGDEARFCNPIQIVSDFENNAIFVSDTGNYCVRMLTRTDNGEWSDPLNVSTVLGVCGNNYCSGGCGNFSRGSYAKVPFYVPSGVVKIPHVSVLLVATNNGDASVYRVNNISSYGKEGGLKGGWLSLIFSPQNNYNSFRGLFVVPTVDATSIIRVLLTAAGDNKLFVAEFNYSTIQHVFSPSNVVHFEEKFGCELSNPTGISDDISYFTYNHYNGSLYTSYSGSRASIMRSINATCGVRYDPALLLPCAGNPASLTTSIRSLTSPFGSNCDDIIWFGTSSFTLQFKFSRKLKPGEFIYIKWSFSSHLALNLSKSLYNYNFTCGKNQTSSCDAQHSIYLQPQNLSVAAYTGSFTFDVIEKTHCISTYYLPTVPLTIKNLVYVCRTATTSESCLTIADSSSTGLCQWSEQNNECVSTTCTNSSVYVNKSVCDLNFLCSWSSSSKSCQSLHQHKVAVVPLSVSELTISNVTFAGSPFLLGFEAPFLILGDSVQLIWRSSNNSVVASLLNESSGKVVIKCNESLCHKKTHFVYFEAISCCEPETAVNFSFELINYPSYYTDAVIPSIPITVKNFAASCAAQISSSSCTVNEYPGNCKWNSQSHTCSITSCETRGDHLNFLCGVNPFCYYNSSLVNSTSRVACQPRYQISTEAISAAGARQSVLWVGNNFFLLQVTVPLLLPGDTLMVKWSFSKPELLLNQSFGYLMFYCSSNSTCLSTSKTIKLTLSRISTAPTVPVSFSFTSVLYPSVFTLLFDTLYYTFDPPDLSVTINNMDKLCPTYTAGSVIDHGECTKYDYCFWNSSVSQCQVMPCDEAGAFFYTNQSMCDRNTECVWFSGECQYRSSTHIPSRSSNDHNKSKLIAGLAGGISGFVLLVIGVIIFFYYNKRKQKYSFSHDGIQSESGSVSLLNAEGEEDFYQQQQHYSSTQNSPIINVSGANIENVANNAASGANITVNANTNVEYVANKTITQIIHNYYQQQQQQSRKKVALQSMPRIQEQDISPFLTQSNVLNSGATSIVYQLQLKGQSVAAKIYNQSVIRDKQIQAEVRSLSFLRHSNIVAVYSIIERKVSPFSPVPVSSSPSNKKSNKKEKETEIISGFLMEKLTGSLADIFSDSTFSISNEQKLEFCRQISSALEYAHSEGIFHQDLKLENILCKTETSQTPICKISDFGSAHIISTSAAATALSNTTTNNNDNNNNNSSSSSPRMTAGFAPPETFMTGSFENSNSSPSFSSSSNLGAIDVFSLGMLMWCMFNQGVDRKLGRTAEQINVAIRDGRRPKIDSSRIPSPEIERLIVECWSQDPNSRPTMSDVASRLEKVISETTGASVSSSANAVAISSEEHEEQQQSGDETSAET